MSIKFVTWHKQEFLEKIAEKIHQAYECVVPIDIDYIVEMMGLDISDVSRLKEDFTLYGFLGKVKGKFVIFVQKGDFKLTNYHTNVTIAEELAHFILHKEHFKNVGDFQEAFEFYTKISKKSEMMMELNAKYLAGAILIPRDDLKRRSMEIYKENESLFADLLKKRKEEICEAIIDSIASRLSDVYHASEGAISFRLKSRIIGFKEFLKGKCNGEIK